jgi:hypothetical protein
MERITTRLPAGLVEAIDEVQTNGPRIASDDPVEVRQ